MPKDFYRVIAAQFFSALADNALLIVAIALLEERGVAGWWAPLLKFSLAAFYVVLAPLVGPLADAFPKARLMAAMNGLKLAGVFAMLAGTHPVAAFAIIGFAAAAYAPAKYGLVTEMVPPGNLVAANSWIEVTAVGAVLLGTLVGGFLVSDVARGAGAMLCGLLGGGSTLVLSQSLVLVVYAIAALLNVGIASARSSYGRSALAPVALARDFLRANATLWRDREGGLSLAVTSLFWGTGATLQFAVLRWAVDVLGLPLHKAAYLQAIAAVGVVAGAIIAGRWIGIHVAKRVLPAGIALGVLALVVPLIDSVALAVPLLVLVGVVSGVFVVPMNALLQHRGYQVLTPGRSIAVQGFNENLSVLVMLAVYAALLSADVPITAVMCGLGTLLILAMGVLVRRERASPRTTARSAAAGSPVRVDARRRPSRR